MANGKTYYYLLDAEEILHVCSDGVSLCGLDAKKFNQVVDDRLILYPVCSKCMPPKKATFNTKAELIAGEQNEL